MSLISDKFQSEKPIPYAKISNFLPWRQKVFNTYEIFNFFREIGVGGDADQERRVRREIANSNERRRMQSINAGFQSLRTLLPHHEGEKLSKVSCNF